MKIVTLAAGFAAGYVLGTRAGRERYEQIAANARRFGSHPTVVQAQEKAKSLLETGTHRLSERVGSGADASQTGQPAAIASPRQPRRKSAPRTPALVVDNQPLT
jgi:hypothetical protein